MAVFKCKMCGGTLEVNNETVAVCQYCGTKQTLPKLDDDRKANLYDRANHFRRNNEFDKAMGIYEQILNEDNTDAESYWSLVLCRYGIEYVEDPSSRKRIPTVNRAQFTSIYDDEDYKASLQYADGYQKEVYEQEAAAINDIQKGILAISNKEEPFDVFICYKESDNSGRRTPDSVLATELYHELTREGYKVFFSRITLEDKLGTAYEPYIFAALNSAKVMVVLGTKPEYFNAVWVKNEWSRYLALTKNGARKILIPAYRDMDPYDLPEEFSHLQAQDMSKLGFMQDLIRGIKKMVSTENSQTVVKETVAANNINIDTLIKRAFLVLEDGDFDKADALCEQVLNTDPENAMAYLCKLMIELRVNMQEGLVNCKEPFDSSSYYQKAIRFADNNLKTQLREYIQIINDRNEQMRLENFYSQALADMESAKSEEEYKTVADAFKVLSPYKNSDALCEECLSKAEQKRLETERKAVLDREKKEKLIKREKKIAAIITPIIVVIIAFVIVLNTVIIPDMHYKSALAALESKDYDTAYNLFTDIGDYKDSAEQAIEAKYQKALTLLVSQDYENASTIFFELGNYKDSEKLNKKAQILPIVDADVGEVVKLAKDDRTETDYGYWTVLEKEDNKVLLLGSIYSSEDVNILGGWASSSLRARLNGIFMTKEICPEVQERIIETELAKVGSNPSTKDKIFILSKDETDRYISKGLSLHSYTDYFLRDVNNGKYAYITDKGRIEEIEYISVLEPNISSTDNDRDPFDVIEHNAEEHSEALKQYEENSKAKIHNEKIINAKFRPAMWIDISGIE